MCCGGESKDLTRCVHLFVATKRYADCTTLSVNILNYNNNYNNNFK